MPEVILKKFIASILIGAGCLCGGIIGLTVHYDLRLFILSSIIFVGMMIKGGMIYYRFKKDRYVKVVGTVTRIDRQLFASHKNVEIVTNEGQVKLYLPKEVKIKIEKTYCFYFAKDTSKSPVIVNNYITAKLNTDNFIGCEEVGICDIEKNNIE